MSYIINFYDAMYCIAGYIGGVNIWRNYLISFNLAGSFTHFLVFGYQRQLSRVAADLDTQILFGGF